MAIAPLPQETNLGWLTSSSGQLQLRPLQEFLIGVDWDSGKYVPALATKWEISSDAKSWTFQLREKVPFHFGLGDLTAKDVAHSMEMLTQKESINSDTPFWQGIIEKVEAVSDQQVVLRLKTPEVQLDEFISAERNLLMLSKALWDKEGKAGYDKRPAGTGPYQYKERKLGEFIRFELAPGKHWRVAPEAKEIDLRPTPEDVTRLAALLAGEAHISDLSRDLQKDALGRGLKVATSAIPAIHHEFFLGGQYYLTP
ncbi:MAG: ABC transporter substrate-binding protein, partial [Chloroflexota bacterium]